MKIAVTGMGMISSIGLTVEENLQSLMAKKPGIFRLKNLNSRLKDKIKVGEVSLTNDELIERLALPEDNNYSRTAMLAEVAAKEALQGIDLKKRPEFRTGLISATSVGGMDMTEKNYNQGSGPTEECKKYVTAHSPADATDKVSVSLGIKDFVTTISTACSSSANAIMLGARMIKAGELDRVVVGGSDCLSKFTMNGFNTLMILSDDDCRPFDRDRKGLNLGEAAAFLVLESERVLKEEGRKPLAYISGYANANDAFHQTASSENGEGATLAMRHALKLSGLNSGEIDYINAHGTATPNNDLSESKAILRVFGESIPMISSTKAFTGHTLAAAAGVEAVFSILALQNDLILPNLNFENPIVETGIIPETRVKKMKLNHVLSNSFGFGGNCSTLIFSAS